MARIYKNQSSLRITVRSGINLSGSDECLLKYIKPDGEEGFFPATVEDEAGGVLVYEVKEGDLDISGWWKFWIFISFIGGRSAPGRMKRVFVWEEGE